MFTTTYDEIKSGVKTNNWQSRWSAKNKIIKTAIGFKESRQS